ncbi:MAG: hypothetical protein Q4G34_05760, partial [Micrococcus sp.]|nr:hypothetical protein [Micrococcus sp.]
MLRVLRAVEVIPEAATILWGMSALSLISSPVAVVILVRCIRREAWPQWWGVAVVAAWAISFIPAGLAGLVLSVTQQDALWPAYLVLSEFWLAPWPGVVSAAL